MQTLTSSGSGVLVNIKVRPPIPSDNICQICSINEQKYIKGELYVCKNCWDRKTYESLSNLSDNELEILRAEKIKTACEEKKVSIVNANNINKIGFNNG